MGDSDGDGDVDLADFDNWLDCVTGPDAGPLAVGCATFDFDMDTDVDVVDFAAFQQVFDTP